MMRLIDTLARNYVRVAAVLFGAIMLYEGIKFTDTMTGRVLLWIVAAALMIVGICKQETVKKTLNKEEMR